MAAEPILWDRREFVLTDAGRQLLADYEPCVCEYIQVINGALLCAECGTVYGVVYAVDDWGFVRVRRRRQHRRAAS